MRSFVRVAFDPMLATTPNTASSADSEIAAAFCAGRYHDVLERTIDSRRGGSDPDDGGFVVGALAFVGRVEEAELLFDTHRRTKGTLARTLAAGGFFVCVAQCRAGQLERAVAVLRRAVADTRGRRDAWCYALLHQAAACCRYFRAEYSAASRAATRALASAQIARFAYGQMLANDMRGHLLLQHGRFHDGLAVLQRAREQARQLEFTSNAHAIEISIALQRARLALPERALPMLADLVTRETTHDSYSRRAVLIEQAILLAWCGRASEAERLVEDEIAPRCNTTDARARAALLLVRAQVARVRVGSSAARALATEAADLVRNGIDVVRETEAWALVLGASRDLGDAETAARATARLLRLAEGTGIYRAAAALAAWDSQRAFVPADGDELHARLAAIARGRAAVAIDTGLLGLLPEALRVRPGRRIHAFEHGTIIEDRGDVVALPALSQRSIAMLRTVAREACSRESLFRAVWGLERFDPDRHGSLVKTTISRTRASLRHAADWIVTSEGLYGLNESTTFVDHTSTAPAGLAFDDRERKPAAIVSPSESPRTRAILSLIQRRGQVAARDVAIHLRTSLRTASRELSTMHARRLLGRAGAGRGTRYYLSRESHTGAEGDS